ncbi:MAG TPA: sulfur oxidation c-type cytochrome SoxX [Burkholderiales bacterium]|nr:sulfur oxidation c-type cytochrome SoxX [Burkholderiales bacterium]
MKITTLAMLAGGAALLASCATGPGAARSEAISMMKRDFKTQGIAGLERLNQDKVQAACDQHGNNPPPGVVAALQKEQMAAIKWPADGKLIGDWKAGEKVAQNGRGMAWSDKGPVGGSCYNCHQIGPATTSFGTIGPSLYQFGKARGYSEGVQRYAYGKIYNAKAYNLCSQMPRFGHTDSLSEQQMKDLTALLMDPASPVNR